MKIAFNMLIGFANNGGCKTILKCHDIFKKLNHESLLIAKDKGSFTWFDFDDPINYIPKDLDVFIATGCDTVKKTLESDAKIKAWYIRAHENWRMTEEELLLQYNKNIIKIVNSNGLKKKLIELGIKEEEIYVIYQGVDLDLWNDYDCRDNNKTNIGCLFSNKRRKRFEDFISLKNKLGTEKYKYYAFGTENCNHSFLTKYYKNPSIKELNDLYNKCHIWFAPTDNEGLHNVPLEAGLCGCLIVCGNHPLNGMIYDYAFNNISAMIYDNIDHACDIIRNPHYNITNNMKKIITENIRDRESNMKKMINIFEYYHHNNFIFDTNIISPDDITATKQRIENYKNYYKIKYNICKKINPKRIAEIGIRAGYSAWTFLQACPNAKYYGIDANNGKHGGEGGEDKKYFNWAKKILKNYDTVFIEQDTQAINNLNIYDIDFFHIDGDHTTAGVIHDLDICFKVINNNGYILVDDIDYIKDVKIGVDKWINKMKDYIEVKYIKSFRGECLIKKIDHIII